MLKFATFSTSEGNYFDTFQLGIEESKKGQKTGIVGYIPNIQFKFL